MTRKLPPLATSVLAGVGAVIAAAFLGIGAATAAAGNWLSFGDSGPTATFGANAVVRIDGTIAFERDCPKPGIADFVYAATDVYVVPAGFTGGELADVGGRPNTIVAGASMFTDEVIAVTPPGGALDEGVYDVVYDTCQDGRYDAERDAVFANAITVEMPDVIPLASGAITSIKNEARAEYEAWLATRLAMKGIFKLADRALKVQCKAGNPVGCAMRKVDYFDGIKERFLTLLLSQANHYLAIADDPPDPDFDTLTTIEPVTFPRDRSDSEVANATAALLGPTSAEAAVAAALLRAVERYQGAQAAGDGEWALVHARQARNLAATLRRLVPATGAAFAALESSVAAEAAELDAGSAAARTFVSRVFNSGLTAAEWRTLRNQGLGAGEIAALESELRDGAFEATGDSAAVLAALDDAIAAHSATAAALEGTVASWNAVAGELEGGDEIADRRPAISAGGPYEAAEGGALTLAGSSARPLDSAAWDLDADGEFDDATGLAPTATFAEAGTHVIGLRAAADGRDAVAYAVVVVAEANRAPTLSAPTPAQRSATVVVGDSRTFSVVASDSDGDPLAYEWKLDGVAASATGPSFTFVPLLAQVGSHVVEVTADDGTAAGGATRRAWDVVVLAEDGDGDGWTATTDCDEVDAAIHPTAIELLGNGLDDDCDTGTPDAPPGGLTGSMLAWGSNQNGTIGDPAFTSLLAHSPVAVPGYDDVVQIAGGDRSGYAVLANGEVRAWGFNGAGNLGIGVLGSPERSPVSPLAVGGAPGTRLTGITQIESGHLGNVVARRVDGGVVSWGDNQQQQGGDGSTVAFRLFPVRVLTAAGGPPLTGVRAVEAGTSQNQALMNDGTVRAWGQVHCDGGTSIRIEPFPVGLTKVGSDVRQVSSTSWTLFLKKDGTVLSCGAVQPLAGRPVPTIGDVYVPKPVTGFGPGSGVVDIAAGLEGGLALKSDGTVWTWGHNRNGSLDVVGVPANGSAPAPLQVPLPPGPPVVDVELDDACHALALRADGSLLSWGCDFFGQVGDGAQPSDWVVETPTLIDLGGASAVRLAGAAWNSLVLTRPAGAPGWERPETWVQASVADATVAEATGGSVAISISAALAHDVTVSWSLRAGTAGPSDVALGEGTATVPAGSTSVDVSLPVLDDVIDEDEETFTIVLEGASHGMRLARTHAAGTISDDDEPPAIDVSPVTVTEGNTSLTDATVSVSLSQPSGKQVAVAFATADGSATAPADYGAVSGRLTIPPGQTTAIVHVPVRGDALAEPEEALTVAIAEPENATLGDAAAAVTIADDEPLVLQVTSPTVVEGDAGTTQAQFTVALAPAAPAGTTVSLRYDVEGLSATVPDDVAPASGTLEFAAGDSSRQVTVEVRGDRIPEPAEAFRLVLTGVESSDGRTILYGDGTLATIVDDDDEDTAPPTTTATADPPANASGWNRQNVTVTLVATDSGGSGVEDVAYRLTGAQTGGQTVSGDTATIGISAEGATTVTYSARDKAGNVETERTLTVRIDRTAPTLDCSATPDVLWPPNHELVAVTLTVDLADTLSGASGFTLAGVESSEPDDAPGVGDGTTVDDIQGFETGTSDTTGLLRAERAGEGPGRVYTVSYAARDQALNETTCSTKVAVPRDVR